jgi:hypothetical protein
MADWKTTCDINSVLYGDDGDDREKASKAADLLDRCPAFKGTGFSERLRRAARHEDYEDAMRAANHVLGDIYDYADAERIWMGYPARKPEIDAEVIEAAKRQQMAPWPHGAIARALLALIDPEDEDA